MTPKENGMASKSHRATSAGGAPPYNLPDNLTEAGARALAARIEQFWAQRGYRITMRVEPCGCDGSWKTCWSVRSNLVAGLPVGEAATEMRRAA
jgi:hypothetical protein